MLMAIITPEIAEFLKRVRLCFVATVSPDGRPNVSPKGTLIGLDSEHIAFAEIRSPDTVTNITHNPRVEISAIDPISRRGYLFEGIAKIYTSGNYFDEAHRIYAGMNIKSAIKSIIVIDTESVSEVTSPLYDSGASEDEIRKSWIRRYTQS